MNPRRPEYQRSPYGRFPLKIDRGEGMHLVDAAGRRYLDLCAGWGAVSCGHRHPVVEAALAEALAGACATGYLDPPAQADGLALLNPLLPGDLGLVALYSTGAEALDFALRLARNHTGRAPFVAFRGHFHGKTHGNMYLLGVLPECYGPRPPGYVTVLDAPLAGDAEAIEGFARALEAASDPPPAAVILEPVVGYSGPAPLPAEALRAVRDFCDRHGALMIMDEVFTSMFRCGAWFEAGATGVIPDILVFGKGMGNGFPVAGVAATSAVAPSVAKSLPGSTYSGNGLAWAAVKGVLACLSAEADRLPRHVEQLEALARDWAASSALCRTQGLEVRGKGAMIGLRLGEQWQHRVQELVCACLDEGVVPSHGQQGLRLTPPVLITAEEWCEGLGRIEVAIAKLA